MNHFLHCPGAAFLLVATVMSCNGIAAAVQPGSALVRSAASYRSSGVLLTRADGRRVALDDELRHTGPVVLNFVFTTCSAVCPIASQTFSQLQGKLKQADHVRLMTISTDPLNDTPAVLRTYASKYGASKDWQFYTGTVDASVDAQRAFDAYRGDKMNHAPFTLVRAGIGKSWVRLEGFPSADDLLRELQPAPARQ